jgi:hypothetical protein
LKNLVAVEPTAKQDGTATTNKDNRDDGNDKGGVILFGFFSAGRHLDLVVHDFFSCLKKWK